MGRHGLRCTGMGRGCTCSRQLGEYSGLHPDDDEIRGSRPGALTPDRPRVVGATRGTLFDRRAAPVGPCSAFSEGPFREQKRPCDLFHVRRSCASLGGRLLAATTCDTTLCASPCEGTRWVDALGPNSGCTRATCDSSRSLLRLLGSGQSSAGYGLAVRTRYVATVAGATGSSRECAIVARAILHSLCARAPVAHGVLYSGKFGCASRTIHP